MISRLLYFLGAVFVKIYSKLMFRLDIKYRARMPGGAKIIVVNHPTTTDPFVITCLSRGQASILIKDILFDVPLFGRYLKWAGHVPVSIKKGKEAFLKALDILKKGRSVIVFIEGDITPKNGKKTKPRTGAIRLALSSKAPVVPVGIAVNKENIILIKSVIKGKKDVGTWYFKGPYAITIGKTLKYFGNVENKRRVRLLTEALMQDIVKLTEESEARINLSFVRR